MPLLPSAALGLALVLTGAVVTPPASTTVPRAAPAVASEGPTTWSVPLSGLSMEGPRGTAALSQGTTTRVFTLAAVSWSGSATQDVTSIALRTRSDGTWSTWYELGIADSGTAGSRVGSEPLIAPGADGVQARVRTASGGAPAGLRIDLVDPGADPAQSTALAASPTSTAVGDEIRPAVVSRAQWGADETRTKKVSRSVELKAMYVHHTAGANRYSRAKSASIVRAIWAYHVKAMDWPDIAYQFLVDRFGTVYEGRRGSLHELVVGAQAGGFNADTIGVSAMGNFSTAKAPSAMVDSIVDVLAWQAHKWNLDPMSKVRLRTSTSTKSQTRWKNGVMTPALPVIRGHRDTNYTACPGTNLYRMLPGIRSRVDKAVAKAIASYGRPPGPLARPAATRLVAGQTPVRLYPTLRVRWMPVAGATRYQVLVRTAKHGKDVYQTTGTWFVDRTTTATTYLATVPAGQTWSFAVRALDANGRPGKVSSIGTTTRPVARSLMVRSTARGKAWKYIERDGYFRGEAFVTRARHATIKVEHVKRAVSVWVVAATGPGHGRVALYAGKTRVRTISLESATDVPLQVFSVTLPKRFSGTVRLTTIDAGKQVRISGLVTPRT